MYFVTVDPDREVVDAKAQTVLVLVFARPLEYPRERVR
jgi:hypothetical protein